MRLATRQPRYSRRRQTWRLLTSGMRQGPRTTQLAPQTRRAGRPATTSFLAGGQNSSCVSVIGRRREQPSREGIMGRANTKRVDPYKQRADETHLQFMSRLAALKDA